MDLHFLDFGTSWEWSASLPGLFIHGERAAGTHWIGGWVGPRAGLDDVEKRQFLTLPRLNLRPLGRPDRSQSLYRLSYPGSLEAWGPLQSHKPGQNRTAHAYHCFCKVMHASRYSMLTALVRFTWKTDRCCANRWGVYSDIPGRQGSDTSCKYAALITL
jgi:hypothetical protein